jgi:hypothetical protein
MGEKKALNPMAMSAEEAARTLGIPQDWLDEDLAAGAPTNDDGTINLVHYAAWLNAAPREKTDAPA